MDKSIRFALTVLLLAKMKLTKRPFHGRFSSFKAYNAFCGIKRTSMRLRADALRSKTDALKATEGGSWNIGKIIDDYIKTARIAEKQKQTNVL